MLIVSDFIKCERCLEPFDYNKAFMVPRRFVNNYRMASYRFKNVFGFEGSKKQILEFMISDDRIYNLGKTGKTVANFILTGEVKIKKPEDNYLNKYLAEIENSKTIKNKLKIVLSQLEDKRIARTKKLLSHIIENSL